jgi:uncharacterized protein YxjI
MSLFYLSIDRTYFDTNFKLKKKKRILTNLQYKLFILAKTFQYNFSSAKANRLLIKICIL